MNCAGITRDATILKMREREYDDPTLADAPPPPPQASEGDDDGRGSSQGDGASHASGGGRSDRDP